MNTRNLQLTLAFFFAAVPTILFAKIRLPILLDSSVEINAVAQDSDFIWIGTNNGLIRVEKNKRKLVQYNQSSTSFLPSDYITSIACGQNGNVWIGTNKGLVFYNGYYFVKMTTENSDLVDNRISAVAVDQKNNVWIGTLMHGLVRYNGFRFTNFNTSNSGLPDNCIYSLSTDEDGKLWIGLLMKGLATFDEKKWNYFPENKDGLDANNILFVKKNYNGTYFIATRNQGCFEFNGTQFNPITTDISTTETINGIYFHKPSGKLIMCCRDGIYIACGYTFILNKKLTGVYHRVNGLQQLLHRKS